MRHMIIDKDKIRKISIARAMKTWLFTLLLFLEGGQGWNWKWNFLYGKLVHKSLFPIIISGSTQIGMGPRK